MTSDPIELRIELIAFTSGDYSVFDGKNNFHLDATDRQVLGLLGLFDRAADAGALAALRREPMIPGLTHDLTTAYEPRWRESVARLFKSRVLTCNEETGDLEADPWVCKKFGDDLRAEDPEAWRAGHERLYEHYRQATDELPETLETMLPLYSAVVHGCRAGRVQETFDKVYRKRLHRGYKFFSQRQLRAFTWEIKAVAAFFERLWDRPDPRLTEEFQSWILNEAGFVLRALGRLPEAVEPMQACLDRDLASVLPDRIGVSRTAGNLSGLRLALGEVARAVEVAEEGVRQADRIRDPFQRMASRTILAQALHQAGRLQESAAIFGKAEALQAKRESERPLLHSNQGYHYVDLLLTLCWDGESESQVREACEEVVQRATQTLRWAEKHHASLLDLGHNHLGLGRGHLSLAQTSSTGFTEASEHLGQAVEILRQSGDQGGIARGLLARAALHRLRAIRGTGDSAADLDSAASDLSEVQEIAERCHMKLHEADTHREWTRLHLITGDREAARRHFERARELVTACGYGRREPEVAWLKKQLDDVTPNV